MKQEFLSQIKTLKSLPCVKSQRLVVGGPSITTPVEKSKGFQYALVSYHEDRAALAEYQASSEHERYEISLESLDLMGAHVFLGSQAHTSFLIRRIWFGLTLRPIKPTRRCLGFDVRYQHQL